MVVLTPGPVVLSLGATIEARAIGARPRPVTRAARRSRGTRDEAQRSAKKTVDVRPVELTEEKVRSLRASVSGSSRDSIFGFVKDLTIAGATSTSGSRSDVLARAARKSRGTRRATEVAPA